MINAAPNNPMYQGWIEMENPGEMRGTLGISDDVPVLFSDHVVYDVTLKVADLVDVMALIDHEVVVTTDLVQRAGMIAPELGHIVVSAIRAA